jgi:adenine-specific DNA-methyltransferase
MILLNLYNSDYFGTDIENKVDRNGRSGGNGPIPLNGQPEVVVKKQGNKYIVAISGLIYNDLESKDIKSAASRVTMWELDTDYDGKVLYPTQVFFPRVILGYDEVWGDSGFRTRVSDLSSLCRGTISLPFRLGNNRQIAVKIIDEQGNESLKIITVSE